MTGLDHESPRFLVDGSWVRDPRAHVLRWQAREPVDPKWHVACPFCDAVVGQDCHHPGGEPSRHSHARRVEAARAAIHHEEPA